MFMPCFQLRDCEMGAIVNRELKQRVRPVNSVSADRQVAKADIKHLARIVQNFDKRWKLWEDEQPEKKDENKGNSLVWMAMMLLSSFVKPSSAFLDLRAYVQESHHAEKYHRLFGG
jgi:hypothetical protein